MSSIRSSSSRRYRLRPKPSTDRRIPSVDAIVTFAADEQHVEVQRRTPSGWLVEDLIGQDELALDLCHRTIPRNAIYGDLLLAAEAS